WGGRDRHGWGIRRSRIRWPWIRDGWARRVACVRLPWRPVSWRTLPPRFSQLCLRRPRLRLQRLLRRLWLLAVVSRPLRLRAHLGLLTGGPAPTRDAVPRWRSTPSRLLRRRRRRPSAAVRTGYQPINFLVACSLSLRNLR